MFENFTAFFTFTTSTSWSLVPLISRTLWIYALAVDRTNQTKPD